MNALNANGMVEVIHKGQRKIITTTARPTHTIVSMDAVLAKLEQEDMTLLGVS